MEALEEASLFLFVAISSTTESDNPLSASDSSKLSVVTGGVALLLSPMIGKRSKYQRQRWHIKFSKVSCPSCSLTPCPVLLAQSCAWTNFVSSSFFDHCIHGSGNTTSSIFHLKRKRLSKVNLSHSFCRCSTPELPVVTFLE